MNGNNLLEVKNVTKVFKLGGLLFGTKLTAVDNVSFTLEGSKPTVLTLAGESGSGKTTLSRIILGLIKPTSGKILYKGQDVFELKEKKDFKRSVQPVFQNPFESFNPLSRIEYYLLETAKNYGMAKSDEEAYEVVGEALGYVGLNLKDIKGVYTHELSGGQVQRTSVARALITKPNILVADEPVSMIDASLKMSVINLFLELKQRLNMSIIYITHDLATAYYISDDIAIMNRGSIVEYGPVEKVLTDPLHPYTKILLECIPEPDPKKRWKKEITLSDIEIKEFGSAGCKFAGRCPQVKEICRKKMPTDFDVNGRTVKCWLYDNGKPAEESL